VWRLGSRVLVSSSLWKRSQFSRGDSLRRRNLICAVKGDAEGAFKKTVAIDRMIDALQDANPRELEQLVVENILAFDEVFWIRLAARSDTCKSDDDKKDYEELAATVMSIVDCVVNKTREKIETSTDVLKGILRPVVEGVEEISWPPRDPEAINQMENEIIQREKEGQLDEGFLSEVSAQLRQVIAMDFTCKIVAFRQKKIKRNQGLRLCCKKFFNSMLLRFSPSVATQRKVHYLQTDSHHV
ncbi:hypothetical protein EUTSA_v10005656mg, partial [Eutrema salsugineum]